MSRSKRAPSIRFGTSSFSSKDWVGPFYPPGTAAKDFLSFYATRFDTVEIDATYYAVPSARTVDGWAGKTPENFLISAKFPREIVHGGEGARPDPDRVLVPDAVHAVRDRFLEVMSRLGPRLGPLVIQFPYFNRSVFPAADPFLERLDRFLGDLPDGFTYAVEVRNKSWVAEPLAAICRRHRAALVLVDQAWMPHGDEVEKKFDPVTGGLVYVRLLGDRKAIEAVTTTWDREVLDHRGRLERWAELLVRMLDREVPALVYVNNHYAGHAPATVARLERLVADAAKRKGLEPER